MKKKLWYLQFIIIAFFFLLLSDCKKDKEKDKDFRDIYLGIWTFEVTHYQSQSPPYSTYNYSISYNEGSICYGTGDKDLLINYGSGSLNVSVGSDGAIGNLPGDYHGGKIGIDTLDITFGHKGNYQDLTYINGNKVSLSNKSPGASTTFVTEFTYGPLTVK